MARSTDVAVQSLIAGCVIAGGLTWGVAYVLPDMNPWLYAGLFVLLAGGVIGEFRKIATENAILDHTDRKSRDEAPPRGPWG